MRKSFYAGFAVLFLLFASFSAAATPEKAYENRAVGIKVSSPEQWTFYASEDNAPEHLKSFFRNSTEQNKLLFVGAHSSQTAFYTLYAEAFRGTTLDYFDLLYVNKKDKIDIISARYDVLNDLVQWVFRTKAGQIDMTFVETIAKQGDQVVRLGFWTFTPLIEKYRGDFDRITESTAFLNDRGQWNTSWQNLRENLEGNDIAHVETVKDTRKESTSIVCEGGAKPLLWKVKGKKNTVYVFGSIHLGKPEFYPLAASVESAFDSSEHLVVEVDITSDVSKKELERSMSETRLKNGKTLREVLSPGVYKKLTQEMEKMAIPMDGLTTLKPWVMAVTLTVMKMQSMGYMPDFGVDRYFMDKANKKNMDILELESFSEQVRLFENIGDEKFLAYTMLSLNSIEVDAGKLIKAWLCGDLKTMEAITFEGFTSKLIGDVNLIYEKVYFNRNRKMKEKIKNYLQGDDDYFVVVGAGHLIGDKGIPGLLQKEGYTVTRQ